ncbi:MAG: hypothetical protein O3B64_03525 [bacterium]|nr:hypothetical protein [bacterium]
MVTNLFAAMIRDVMQASETADFFKKGASDRKKTLRAALGPDYPEAMIDYIAEVKGEDFARAAAPIVELAASRQSLIVAAPRLAKEENGFLVAASKALRGGIKERGENHLGRELNRIEEAGGSYKEAFQREVSGLLLACEGKDLPILQLARTLEDEEFAGYHVTVQSDLLGGARLFKEGEVYDDSWRGRLTKVLNAIN